MPTASQSPLSMRKSLPLYVQISELLIRDIAAGRYADGEPLPPERQLATSLGTTVTTLRKSLRVLEEKNLLNRVQGSGNYVQVQPSVDSVYAFFRVELLQGGGLPTAEVLSLSKCAKPADLPAFGASLEAHRIRRLRALNGAPCVLEEIWLDAGYAPELEIEHLPESLYLFYREALGLWITSADDHLSLGVVPDWAPPAFGLTPGAPSVLITRSSLSQSGQVAEVSRSWIDSNVARYVARIK